MFEVIKGVIRSRK